MDFVVALIQSNTELGDFRTACIHINAISAFAMILEDLELDATDTFWGASFVVDSANLGDSIAGIWRILVHGVFILFIRSPESLNQFGC